MYKRGGTARRRARHYVRALNMKHTLEFIERYAMLLCQLGKWPPARMLGRIYRPVRPLVLIYNSMEVSEFGMESHKQLKLYMILLTDPEKYYFVAFKAKLLSNSKNFACYWFLKKLSLVIVCTINSGM